MQTGVGLIPIRENGFAGVQKWTVSRKVQKKQEGGVEREATRSPAAIFCAGIRWTSARDPVGPGPPPYAAT